MSTYVDSLITARDNYAATLATESANPKPSYTIGRQSISWDEYRQSLMQSIKDLTEQISSGSEPFEEIVRGVT